MTLTMNYSIENAIMDFIPVNQSITYVEKSSEMAPKFTTTTLIKVIVLLSMVIISLIGNVATMWSIKQNNKIRRKNRHTWTAVYLLIFHLSFADLLVTMFCTLGDAIWLYTVQWLAGNFMCKIVKYFQMFSLYLSTYVLVLIGIDRWIAVKYPMKSLQMGKRCYHFLTIGYTLSAIFSLPQCFIFHVVKGPFNEEFYQCVTYGFYTAQWQEQLYTTFTLIFMFILPIIIIISTYLSTFRTIAASEEMFLSQTTALYNDNKHRNSTTNRQRIIHKAKLKSLRISVVIVLAFIICWTPYYVTMMIFMFLNPNERLSENLQSAIFFFGMSNSLINPVIYGAFHLWSIKQKQFYCRCMTTLRDGSMTFHRASATQVTLPDISTRKASIISSI